MHSKNGTSINCVSLANELEDGQASFYVRGVTVVADSPIFPHRLCTENLKPGIAATVESVSKKRFNPMHSTQGSSRRYSSFRFSALEPELGFS